MNPRAQSALRAMLTTVILSFSTLSYAQIYPTKPIRMILPFAPGGGTDVVGRLLAQKMSENLGQTVFVENRPGANSDIGTALVARAAPDGYTILFGTSAMSINPSLREKLQYDPIKDFAPVSLVAKVPFCLLAHPSLPAKSLPELVDYARARKGEVQYGSAGIGNSSHLGMELLNLETKVTMLHVPYKSSGEMNAALLGGEIQLFWGTVLPSLSAVKAGRLRALAIGGLKRVKVLPEVPTVAELGYPGFELITWNGVLAPAGTPAHIVSRLNQAVVQSLASPDLTAHLAEGGAELVGGSPEEFGAYIKEEIAKWRRAIEAAGAKELVK